MHNFQKNPKAIKTIIFLDSLKLKPQLNNADTVKECDATMFNSITNAGNIIHFIPRISAFINHHFIKIILLCCYLFKSISFAVPYKTSAPNARSL